MARNQKDDTKAAFTQTYSTASLTHPAQTQTAGDMTVAGADGLDAGEGAKLNAHLDAIRADVLALSKLIVALIDALQDAGIVQ